MCIRDSFQVYYTNLRGFHWNIKGHNFFVLHSQFEKMYDDTAEKVDEIAERILMLGGTPANKFSDYLKVANINEVDKVSNCLLYTSFSLRLFFDSGK